MAATSQDQSHTWEACGDVMVSKTKPGPITDQLWNHYWDVVRTSKVRIIFALALGEISISSTNRKVAADTMKELDLPAVVLTDSRISRGILTALSWLGAKVKAFSWTDIDEACAQASPSPEIRAQLKRIATEFRNVHDGATR